MFTTRDKLVFINDALDAEVGLLDSLSTDELVAEVVAEARVYDAQSCELAEGSRVLVDCGETGYAGGCVMRSEQGSQLLVNLDGQDSPVVLARSAGVYRVWADPSLKKGAIVRTALHYQADLSACSASARRRSHAVATGPTRARLWKRWYYGRALRVYGGGEAADIKFDDGQEAVRVPAFDLQVIGQSNIQTRDQSSSMKTSWNADLAWLPPIYTTC